MAWADWLACINRKDCKTCIEAYKPSIRDSESKKELKKNGPPCKTCKPEMWPINNDVISIYSSVSNQVIVSMNGPVAVKESAIMNRIKLKGIKRKYQEETLDFVSMVANRVIFLRNEENRRKQEK